MRLIIALALLLVACSHGGDTPLPAVPYCGTSVQPCAGYPERAGAVCSTCDDANLSMSCQLDTGRTYAYAACVDSCASCATEVKLSAAPDPRVHVCAPRRYRSGSWCATCDSDDLTLTTELCDEDGFCAPVLCVGACDSCALAP